MNYDHIQDLYLEHYGVKGMKWGKRKEEVVQPIVETLIKSNIDIAKTRGKNLSNQKELRETIGKSAISTVGNRLNYKATSYITKKSMSDNIQKAYAANASDTLSSSVASALSKFEKRNKLRKTLRGSFKGFPKGSFNLLKVMKKASSTNIKSISKQTLLKGMGALNKLKK